MSGGSHINFLWLFQESGLFPGLEARRDRDSTAGSESHHREAGRQDFHHCQQPRPATDGLVRQGVSVYTVNAEGEIDFPVLGKIKVAGMKREEIAETVKNKLITENLVKDPVVTVEFANLCISVLGEVNHPGRFSIDRDRLTILDALSMAGDLTIYGNRYKVMVLRQEGDIQRVYGVDLTSGNHIYTSPAYYLQQNDVYSQR